MVWAAPAAIALCLRFSVDLAKAAAAALLIGAVLSATEQHTDLSASILQGFQCIPASDLPAAAVLAFAQGLQNKTEELSSAQLSCLARLLAAKNLTADFGRYPPDLLLFFDSTEVHSGTCGAFYALASRGNLDLLPRGSARRTGLLRGALACLGVRSSHLSPEQLGSLGALVCDMEPETITASDPGVLENLKLCPALTGAQRDALNAVLLGEGTAYGDPSSWDLQTLQNLGPLVLALNKTTLSLVAEAVREAFGRSIVATYSSQGRSQREKALTLLRAFAAASALSQPRQKRNADGCLSTPLTASTDFDSFLFIDYTTSEQFDLCLSNEFLKANLGPLLQEPLPVEYQLVVKKKLEQIYTSGIPEKQLKVLGPLSRQYTMAEISRWMVTSSDTLSALLDPSDGAWEPPQVQQLLSRYLALGGTLTGPLLRKIGGRDLCDLQEEQIDEISPEEIRVAGQLNISSCSQTKKDQLYRKAWEAFAGQAGTPRVYYCQIQPYLGGAPAKDLKDLAKAGVNMDMDTFLALNPEELQKLSVTDVKNLLGENLPYLKAAENETAVMRWVKRQPQRELDCELGIGLQGGTEEPGTTPQPPPPTSASVAPTPTTLPTPIASSSHPTAKSSTGPPQTPTPSATSPTPPDTTPPHSYTPSAAVSPAATSTARPAPTTSPCSVQCVTPNNAPPPSATLLTTLLSAVNASVASPSSIPAPALTRGATTTSIVTNPAVNTSTPLVSTNPPAPGGTTNPAPATQNTPPPSTPNAPSALGPNSTSAPATTGINLPPHKPTPTPNSTISTQVGVVSPTVKTTTLACKTDAPPASPGPSSTTTTSVVTNPAVNTSTSLVSTNPSAPGGTTNPAPATQNTPASSTPNTPGTLGPNSTSAPATTEMNFPPHKPTPTPNSTISTQAGVVSPTVKTTTLACKTDTPPASPGSSSTTTTSSETTKETPTGVSASPRPTVSGYINLQPEPGSGSRLCSRLVPILTAAVGSLLLRALL